MATTTSYEILTLRNGKWEVEGVTSDKEHAKDQALESLGTGHYDAVKVLGERMDDMTGESTTFTVLNKVDQRKTPGPAPAGKDRRKPADRRKKVERRKKTNRRKTTKKSGGGWKNFLIIFLLLWALMATVAFLVCGMTK